MHTPTSSNEYLLLFRGTAWNCSQSPAEIQKTVEQFRAWYEKLSAEGTLKKGQPLTEEARVISGKHGRTVADGPFAESKEMIGGYFLITAESFDHAVAIAQGNPALDHGMIIEVRQIADDCPSLQRAKRAAEEALAAAAV